MRIGTVNVNFYVDDELYLTKKVCAGQPMEQPDDPELPEGCELAYWVYYGDGTEGNAVNVYFEEVMNGIVNKVTVEKGSTVPRPDAPKPLGNYPFHSWATFEEQ